MTYTLEDFCQDCHDRLSAESGAGGREMVRRRLEKLLANPDFIARHLHHDPDTGIYVFAYGTSEGNLVGKPHDHGTSWAVYGQATGVTGMTEWRRVDDGSRDGHAELAVRRRFRIEPGSAALFDTGTIHPTAHPLPARWVRVTSTDLDRIERTRYDPERQTLQAMTRVS